MQKLLIRLTGLVIFSCFWIPLAGQGLQEDTAKAITLPNTFEYSFHSAINGRNYRILVALPFSYKDSSNKKYPALYLLDGGLELPVATTMFRATNVGPAGDVILIGVAHPIGKNPQLPAPGDSTVDYRQIDYSLPAYPPSDSASAALEKEFPGWNGGYIFHRVLKEEIIPFVEKRFRIDSADRGIHGHSLGGLFANYILLEDPDLFHRYAITDPSLWWDNQSMFLRVDNLKKRTTTLNKKVFLSQTIYSGPIHVGLMYRMAGDLCRARFNGLDLIAEAIEDEEHQSTVSESRALLALYPPNKQRQKAHWCGATSRNSL